MHADPFKILTDSSFSLQEEKKTELEKKSFYFMCVKKGEENDHTNIA